MKLVASALVIAGLLLVADIVVAPVSQAQGVPVTASLDRDTIDLDDTFLLTVTIEGETNVPLPVLPPIDGARLIGRRTESSITILNGKASATFKFSYQFRPLRSGILTIDPIKLELGGTAYETQPLSVTVIGGTGQPAPSITPRAPTAEKLTGQDRFIEAEVDNDNPYVGQQIIYSVRIYSAQFIPGGLGYRPPSFHGFWNGQETSRSVNSTNAAGRRYRVTELRTVLLPALLGETVIEPASMRGGVRFLSLQDRYWTAPVPVNVRPLPSGAPPSFTGAVGNFSISASVDADEAAAGDPITMTVEVSGEGNLATLSAPTFPDLPGWRVFESKSDTDVRFVDDALRGTRTFERILVPNSSGSFTLPAIEFSFFDPETERYRTIATNAIPVRVSGSAAPRASGAAPPATPSEVVRTATDIRHIRPVPDSLSPRGDRITSSPLYWVAWLLPVVAVAAGIAWKYRVRLASGLSGGAQPATPIVTALAATRSARASDADPFPAAGRALIDYLAARLGRPASSLTRQAIADALSHRGVSATLEAEIGAILALIERGRYGPEAPTGPATDLLNDTERLIEGLERELGQ